MAGQTRTHTNDTSRYPDDGTSARLLLFSRQDWWQVVKRVVQEVPRDRVPAVAAGLAFYSLLASVPTFAAIASLYSLLADANNLREHLDALAPVMPNSARQVLLSKLTAIVDSSGTRLSIAFVLSLSITLTIASGGTAALLRSLSVAYDVEETRPFWRLRLRAMWLTALIVVAVTVSLASQAVIPYLVSIGALEGAFERLTWPLLLGATLFGFALLYRYGPDRPAPGWQWAMPGSVLALILWLLVSVALRLYVTTFGRYGETYGALGGAVIILLWFHLTAMAILIGAEFNSEAEKHAHYRTTQQQ